MSIASYKTEIRLGGVPVAVVNAPCDELSTTSGRLFRILDPTRRVMSSSAAVVVKNAVSSAVIAVGDYSINYMDGVVITNDEIGDGIKLDYSYIPLTFIGGSKEYSLELGGDLLDNSSFHEDEDTNNPGYRSRISGLNDVTASFSRFDDLTRVLEDKKLARTPVLISIRPGGAESKEVATGWFIGETVAKSGDVSAIEEDSFSYALAGDIQTCFSFSTNYTSEEAQDLDLEELVLDYFPGMVLE